MARLKVCAYPGCRAAIPADGPGRCARHREPRRDGSGGPGSAYRDPAYRAARRRILARRPLCAVCGAARATQVDHVVPVRDGGTNDSENLRPVCAACNRRLAELATRRRRTPQDPRRPPDAPSPWR